VNSDQMQWMMITADPQIASYAEESGVSKIFVDLETLGKEARQGHVDTHKARHTFSDIKAVRDAITSAELLVRLNPLHDGTVSEVQRAIYNGANRLMLPMFSTVQEVGWFREIVPQHIPITFLAETPAALARIEAWSSELNTHDEVHFGLNDLSLAMGLGFPFETLGGGLLDSAAHKLNEAHIPFGIGGVARSGVGELPAEMVLGEHVRLGSTRAILSRAFQGNAPSLAELQASLDLKRELDKLTCALHGWDRATPDSLERNRATVASTSLRIASAKKVHA
jgi:hypothetical protein